jgi:hypothetical protein
MKHRQHLSLWLVTLAACGGAFSVACGDEAGVDDPMGGAGTGSSTTTGGVSAGSGGASMAGSSSVAGSNSSAGTTSGAGTSGSGGNAGSAGASGGSGGASGGNGGASGGNGGASGGSGGSGVGPFGVVSCQAAFETACKPPIEFVNGDPDGRGKVFTDVIPDVTKTMQDIACTACSILYRMPSEIPDNKHPSKIRLVLDDHGGVAQAGGEQIQFDLDYINGYADQTAEKTKREMLGVLQHETVHLYQNYGTGGTGEGLADLVRARTGYYERNRWQPGGSWKNAYTDSGNFYSWLTGPCTLHMEHRAVHDLDLPYKINKALAGKSGDTASFAAVDSLLQTTFGKSADDLWIEYQDQAF